MMYWPSYLLEVVCRKSWSSYWKS